MDCSPAKSADLATEGTHKGNDAVPYFLRLPDSLLSLLDKSWSLCPAPRVRPSRLPWLEGGHQAPALKRDTRGMSGTIAPCRLLYQKTARGMTRRVAACCPSVKQCQPGSSTTRQGGP
eukprot:1119712-Pelagomonas_calceolata.AAC.2